VFALLFTLFLFTVKQKMRKQKNNMFQFHGTGTVKSIP